MEFIHDVIDVFLRLDFYLNQWVGTMGAWLYLVLFAVIFCETGLVVTPFLPGDSLLFAVGAVAAIDGSPLNVWLLAVLLIAAGVLGDAVNYSIGRYLGPQVFRRDDSWLFNKKQLARTQAFYERHGGKTIILARFIPIVRTFAPFVAGIGTMRYRRFAAYNVTGAIAWVVIFLFAGFLLGNLPIVRRYFQLVILGIIIVSVLPIVIEYLRARRRQSNAPAPQPAPGEASSK